ncbi:MAG: homoserine O-acetyltransferase [Clostridia bacterium]|nr:homoserine O-acetyltransferase [Clostridia bacterium]
MDRLVKTQKYTFAFSPYEFVLESGEKLGPITVAYETYGTLNQRGDNAVLILHALTGSAHAAGYHTPGDREPGWWDPLIGPGKVIDTNRYFVVCSNVLGSCYGTTGPASINPRTGKPYGMDFPTVTIRDMVRVQKRLLDHLGVKHLIAVIGGSMGGMQALEWAVTYPGYMDCVIPIATSAQLTPQCIAFNAVQREAIMQDPDWCGGDYYPGPGPVRGLALARMIGMITYKSDELWNRRFGRDFGGPDEKCFDFSGRFEIENYLHYQGDKLVKRFDANCYIYLAKAMDLHDIARGYDSLEEALRRIRSIVICIGISSDILFPPYLLRQLVEDLLFLGKRAKYVELKSSHGHDAFLVEFERLGAILRQFFLAIEAVAV